MPAIDTFASNSEGLTAPVDNAEAITPNDSADIVTATRALSVGAGGTLRVTTLGGNTVDLNPQDGQFMPIRVSRVHATGTTATGIVGWS